VCGDGGFEKSEEQRNGGVDGTVRTSTEQDGHGSGVLGAKGMDMDMDMGEGMDGMGWGRMEWRRRPVSNR